MKLPTKLNLGKIVVVDTESTCWKGEPPSVHRQYTDDISYYEQDEQMESELIEVGVCLLTVSSLSISQSRRIFVTPRRSEISDYCTELTGITENTLCVKGVTPEQAGKILIEEYKLDKRIWAGWGWDNVRISEQLCYRDVDFSPAYLDLCSLFTVMTQSPKRIGLKEALYRIGKEFQGTQHSAGDDAYNTAVVLRYLVKLSGARLSA